MSLTVAACATVKTAPERGPETYNSETLLPVAKAANRANDADGGILLAYEVKGSGPAGECRLRIFNKDTGISRFINIKMDDNAVYDDFAPGVYDITRMGCGIGLVWDLDRLYPAGFTVSSNQVSYIGKIIFKFAGKQLDEIKKDGRVGSAAAFAAAAPRVPNSMPIVSGFTLLPVSLEMAMEGTTSTGFNVHASGVKDATRALEPLMAHLKSCENQVSKTDPLRLGKLEYVAKYKGGRFSEFKDRHDQNAFSSDLKECISESLSAFQPFEKNDLEIKVNY